MLFRKRIDKCVMLFVYIYKIYIGVEKSALKSVCMEILTRDDTVFH